MKKIKSCIILLMVCVTCLASSTFASARASAQIDYYTMDVTSTGGGRIAIMFSVTGANIMNELGAESIYIFERATLGWELADSFDKDDPNMTKTNAIKYGNTVYFNGESGKEYRIIVTIFAEDKDGESDSRSKTFSITAE